MYSSLITYEVYDLNSSLFLELIREILQAEFIKQRTDFAKTFLPQVVKSDEYLLNPVSDLDINPAFCSVIKAKTSSGENMFHGQSNESNIFIIGVLADGITNLRKILDSAYIILNDMDIKNYLFTYKNTGGDLLISDSGNYKVSSISSDFEIKNINDKDVVYGNITLEAEIGETSKFNTHDPITNITIENTLGVDEISLIQTTNL